MNDATGIVSRVFETDINTRKGIYEQVSKMIVGDGGVMMKDYYKPGMTFEEFCEMPGVKDTWRRGRQMRIAYRAFKDLFLDLGLHNDRAKLSGDYSENLYRQNYNLGYYDHMTPEEQTKFGEIMGNFYRTIQTSLNDNLQTYYKEFNALGQANAENAINKYNAAYYNALNGTEIANTRMAENTFDFNYFSTADGTEKAAADNEIWKYNKQTAKTKADIDSAYAKFVSDIAGQAAKADNWWERMWYMQLLNAVGDAHDINIIQRGYDSRDNFRQQAGQAAKMMLGF